MTETTTESRLAAGELRFKARVKNGVLVPEEPVDLAADQTYLVILQPEPSPDRAVDALAELTKLAQPLGPVDLARNFDRYTHRVLEDVSTES